MYKNMYTYKIKDIVEVLSFQFKKKSCAFKVFKEIGTI